MNELKKAIRLTDKSTTEKLMGLFGEDRVDVLELNMAVDDLKK
jgi:K+-transporting ATPase c subunit